MVHHAAQKGGVRMHLNDAIPLAVLQIMWFLLEECGYVTMYAVMHILTHPMFVGNARTIGKAMYHHSLLATPHLRVIFRYMDRSAYPIDAEVHTGQYAREHIKLALEQLDQLLASA
jgi:hypothetical protein